MTTIRQKRKQETRVKILSAAIGKLKEKGFAGASVQSVMAKAKLTHGSFYAYFRDKDQLIVESLRWGIDEAIRYVTMSIPQELPAKEKLVQFSKFYLSPFHRQRVADGCPIAALSRDFALAPLKLRREFAAEIRNLIEERRRFFGESPSLPLAKEDWIGIMSCQVGALVISRACEGDPLSDEILTNALKFLLKKKET